MGGKFKCPNEGCGAAIPVPDRLLTKKDPVVTCPGCGTNVTLRWDPKDAQKQIEEMAKKAFRKFR